MHSVFNQHIVVIHTVHFYRIPVTNHLPRDFIIIDRICIVVITKKDIVHIFIILEVHLRDSTNGVLIGTHRIFICPLPLNKRGT